LGPWAWEARNPAIPSRPRFGDDGLARSRYYRSAAIPDEGVCAQAERLRLAISRLIEATYPEPGARLVDLDALVAASAKVARLSDVAADFALEPPRSTSDLAGTPMIDEDWLTVSTVHSAKGLEWNVVHILNVTDGMIPSDMALGSEDGLEEERRVFYVALTRARRALHVYVPSRYHHRPRGRDDSHGWTQPSRFLSDSVRSTFDEVTVDLRIGGDLVQPIAINGLDRISSDLEALWS
jgi:DNA helicase-2/ATP-dependent DNA helicase PcrA